MASDMPDKLAMPVSADAEAFDEVQQNAEYPEGGHSTSHRKSKRYSVKLDIPLPNNQRSRSELSSRFSTYTPSGFDELDRVRQFVASFVETHQFDVGVGVLIMANAAVLGFEAVDRVESNDGDYENKDLHKAMEFFFVLAYLLEWTLRILVGGRNCIKDPWIIFDTIVVSVSVFDTFVFGRLQAQELCDSCGMFALARIARVARLARSLRLLVLFSELWLLVQGLLASLKTMLYTLVLLSVLLYAFALIAVDMIVIPLKTNADVPTEIKEIVEEHFATVSVTILTLVQFVCLDSIGSIYKPLILYDWTLMIYFGLVILSLGIVVMNLVTAVIVRGAFQRADEDKIMLEHQKKKHQDQLMDQLSSVFHRLDADSSGQVELNEIVNAKPEEAKLLNDLTAFVDPVKLFELLDVDETGCLDIDEFTEGLYQVAVEATPPTMVALVKTTDIIKREIRLQSDAQKQIEENIDQISFILHHLDKWLPDAKKESNAFATPRSEPVYHGAMRPRSEKDVVGSREDTYGLYHEEERLPVQPHNLQSRLCVQGATVPSRTSSGSAAAFPL